LHKITESKDWIRKYERERERERDEIRSFESSKFPQLVYCTYFYE